MQQQDQPTTKTIVIIGGGFAGINLAKKMAESKYYKIILVDRHNYNYFTPLIYQVATGFLETSNISYPFRKIFRKSRNVQFRLGQLQRIDAENNICILDNGTISYDFLVFATGSVTNYFGNANIEKNAITMKSMADALNMRNILLQTLEEACLTTDNEERRKLLTIVVAGGGPTGVEISGMLAELRKNILAKDYPELRGEKNDIYLVDGAPQLLTQMSKKSHEETYNALVKLGVKIILNAAVKDFSNDKVILSTGVTIDAKKMIWAAGVIGHVFDGIPASSVGRGKRMIVNEFNKVEGLQNIYAIGDTCLQLTDPYFPKGHPQLAQVAIQQGRNLAINFKAMHKEKVLKSFLYLDKGTMAIVGRNNAVADLFHSKVHLKGFLALLTWLFIHLVSLISFRNKVKTLYNWVLAYLTRDQSMRLIIRPKNKTLN